MRNSGFDRLLAGTMLAAAVATPTMSSLRRIGIESVRPPPPSLNGQVMRHREAAPTPTPPQTSSVRRDRARRRAGAAPAAATRAAGARRPAAERRLRRRARPTMSSASIARQAACRERRADRRQAARGIAGQAADDRRSIAPPTARRSKASMPRAAMRRCGSATAASPSNAKAVIGRHEKRRGRRPRPADYPVPDFASAGGADALADGDIKLTNSVLTYARHLSGRPHRADARDGRSRLRQSHARSGRHSRSKITDARDANTALEQLQSAA